MHCSGTCEHVTVGCGLLTKKQKFNVVYGFILRHLLIDQLCIGVWCVTGCVWPIYLKFSLFRFISWGSSWWWHSTFGQYYYYCFVINSALGVLHSKNNNCYKETCTQSAFSREYSRLLPVWCRAKTYFGLILLRRCLWIEEKGFVGENQIFLCFHSAEVWRLTHWLAPDERNFQGAFIFFDDVAAFVYIPGILLSTHPFTAYCDNIPSTVVWLEHLHLS